MGTATLISVEEYLRSSYRPDRDYVDGEVRERALGSNPHATLQFVLAKWFDDRSDVYGFRAKPELTVRITPTRFRVPDVCVLRPGPPIDDYFDGAPFACIEILSPSDGLPDVQERVEEYASIAAENVWVFDPVRQRVWTAADGTLRPHGGDTLTVNGADLTVDLPELWEQMRRRL